MRLSKSHVSCKKRSQPSRNDALQQNRSVIEVQGSKLACSLRSCWVLLTILLYGSVTFVRILKFTMKLDCDQFRFETFFSRKKDIFFQAPRKNSPVHCRQKRLYSRLHHLQHSCWKRDKRRFFQSEEISLAVKLNGSALSFAAYLPESRFPSPEKVNLHDERRPARNTRRFISTTENQSLFANCGATFTLYRLGTSFNLFDLRFLFCSKHLLCKWQHLRMKFFIQMIDSFRQFCQLRWNRMALNYFGCMGASIKLFI